MKKILLRNSIVSMASVFIVFFIVLIISLYNFQFNQRQEMMSLLLDEIETSYLLYDGSDSDFVLLYSQQNGRRITILDQNMNVLADTDNPEIGTNKSDRVELITLGVMVIRSSDTIGIDLLYIAKVLENGNYLRIAIPVQSYRTAYIHLIVILASAGVLITALYSLSMSHIAKQIVKPFNQLRNAMQEIKRGGEPFINVRTPFAEMNEAFKDINDIQIDISNQIQSVEQYKSLLNKVLNEMKQAILLFDGQQTLQYLNINAKQLFSIKEEAIGKQSYQFIRNIKIRGAIATAIENNKPSAEDLEINHRIYRVETFVISSNKTTDKDRTVLLILSDVNRQRNLEQMKRDFFAHASHELKSPLTAIRGYAELIEYNIIQGKETNDIAKQIINQSDLMSNLVEDMLMLSRLEHLNGETHPTTDLNDILNKVHQILEPLAQKKNIEIHIESNKVPMKCDSVDVHKLFKNLIENAIRYSHHNQYVEVLLNSDEKHIIFQVKDSGIGISEENQERIFERFYRVDKGRMDGGTGLGLAIVKHIVIKYRGNINLKSKLHDGTTITITFDKLLNT